MKKIILQVLFLSLLNTYATAKEFQIYSIVQDIPMGEENEIIKKNFYVNIGKNQGISSDTVLDVYRSISRLDPYETKKRFNYKVKIGELRVIHSEESVSIANLKELNNSNDAPLFEISNLMIGDKVKVKVK